MWFRREATTGPSFSETSFSGAWQQSWQSRWQGTWQETWKDFAARSRRIAMAADEADFRKKIWRKVKNKIKNEVANIPFVEDALTAHYCAFDRQTPFYVKAALVGAVVYFLVPDDLIPDSIPVLGVADDAAVLAAAMKIFASHIKPEHREAARRSLQRMRA
ncbi:MAG TPA: DUF1232 domain-containing protein [Xanthobacteraceae bacterium]|jgi:uncharacterized membrane protein YkvA (DUF1232 family)|nr:DUF1232 domain-containing protein [Xanthobacteraceae bacterium]